LTDQEKKAIKEGRLVVGMSKPAVIMSRGYPPEHRTPSLDVSPWVYWEARFRTKAVYFGEDGRTILPPQGEGDL
jgi:hypothetical protein